MSPDQAGALQLENHTDKQGTGLLSPVLTRRMAELFDNSFNTYVNYQLVYEQYFLPAFSPDDPAPAESSAYMGNMIFRKSVDDEISHYAMEQSMRGYENRQSMALFTMQPHAIKIWLIWGSTFRPMATISSM